MDSGINSIENDVPVGPVKNTPPEVAERIALGRAILVKARDEARQKYAYLDAQREDAPPIPSAIQKRFTTVGTEKGNRFYYRDAKSRLAFEDFGSRMSTEHSDAMVIISMVEMAVAKGWTKMKISGHADFKHEIWLEASLRGIEISGYQAKDIDIARLNERQEISDKVRPELKRDYKVVAEVMADVLKQKGYSLKSIERTMEEAEERLSILQVQGKPAPGLKMYDKSAPRRRESVAPKVKARDKDKERTIGGR